MWVIVVGALLCLESPARAEQACVELARALEAEARTPASPRALLEVAPFLSLDAVRGLIGRLPSQRDDELGFDSSVAAGLSRHAEALRLLRELPPPSTPVLRLGRALGMLALGEGADTGTITRALYEGAVEERRRTARTLALLPQKRPRMMLFDAMLDPDERVRWEAARVFIRLGSARARRTLVELASSGEERRRRRAAALLAGAGFSLRAEEAQLLTPAARLRALILDASRGRRGNLRQLSLQTRAGDEGTRTAAFAALALLGPDGLPLARKLEKLLAPKGKDVPPPPELVTALALLGDDAALALLPLMEREAAGRALAVVDAFSGGGARAELDPELTEKLMHTVAAWQAAGFVDDPALGRALRAIERIEPGAAAALSRRRLAGGEGRSLRSAVYLLGRRGAAGDVTALLDLARRSPPPLRTAALVAAARICER